MTAGRKINSDNRDYGTPLKYARAIQLFFDGIELDPCSNRWSVVHAQTEYRLPEKDGLMGSWDYRTIFVNPPYGRDSNRHTSISDWIQRCNDARNFYGSEVIALLPVATNTKHWKKYIWDGANSICFLYDTRLKFLIRGKETGKGAPMACALVYWGKRVEKFMKHFSEFGATVNLK